MSRAALRAALALILATISLVVGGELAHADDNAKLSNVVKGPDGTVSGILTVKAGDAVVDRSSLVMSVGGKDFPVTTQPAATVDRSTILLIDRSGSMREQGMATVRSSVDQFLQLAPKDVKIGVVSFADQPTVDLPPTTDHQAVHNAVAQLKSAGDTSLYDAVGLAVQTLGASGERNIVLLSDGKDTTTPKGGPQAEDLLKRSGVRAEVIAFKTSDTDNLALGYLAAAGQGSVKEVGDPSGVAQAFSAAAKALESQVSWSAKPDSSVSGKQDVVLRGKHNGAAFSATGTVDLGAAPEPTPTATPTTTAPGKVAAAPVPAAPEAPAGLSSMMTKSVIGLPLPVAVAALLLFAGLLLLVMTTLSPVFKSARRERVESIEQYVNQTARRATETVRTTNVTGIAESLVQLGERVVEGRESTPKTVRLLQRADLPWRAGEWAVLRVISMVVGLLLGLAVVRGGGLQALLGAVLGTGVGVVLPPMVLSFLANRRAKKFERQLPDVLTLVASSLSTGFSLPQALDAVSHDVAQPAAKEFSRAMAETRIGADIEESLERMATRMDSTNMRWTAMAIGIQRKVGGNLAETLRMTAATLREREALFRQVRALSAEGRLSAWILILLPIGIFLWMLYVNPDYIALLWSSLIGIAMCVVAVVLMVVGILWMRKVVEVEV